MQMSMRKLSSHTILQNYPLWCCCHVMYKLLYPSIRVRTSPLVSVRVRVSVSVTLLRILFCMCPQIGQSENLVISLMDILCTFFCEMLVLYLFEINGIV